MIERLPYMDGIPNRKVAIENGYQTCQASGYKRYSLLWRPQALITLKISSN